MYICTDCSLPLLLVIISMSFLDISSSQATDHSFPSQLAFLINPCSPGDPPPVAQPWSNDIIPYTIKDNLSDELSTAVQDSIYQIESKTCLRYVPHTNQQDHIEIHHNQMCCSHKGRVGYGLHYLYLHESCMNDEQMTNIIATASSAKWESQTRIDCECGGSIYVGHPSKGNIKSPGYPLDYASRVNCVWKLWIPPGTILEATIVNFELEDDSECAYDYLEFVKQSENGRLENISYKKKCGTITNEKLNFTSGSLSLRFVSDMDTQAKGFYIEYKSYEEDTQILCSEFNGGCSHECVSFNETGEKLYCSCNEGYGLSEDQRTCKDIDECSVKKGGCNQRCRNTEGSFYCHCKPGFGLAKDDKKKCLACGGNLNESRGNFSSPGYPSSYLENQNCQWTIHVLPQHYLRVVVTNLSIPISKRCVNDYLKLQHGSFRYKKRICGHFFQIRYIVKEATRSTTYFKYHTRQSNISDYTGFTISYEQVPISELTPQELNTVYINDISIPYETNNWLPLP